RWYSDRPAGETAGGRRSGGLSGLPARRLHHRHGVRHRRRNGPDRLSAFTTRPPPPSATLRLLARSGFIVVMTESFHLANRSRMGAEYFGRCSLSRSSDDTAVSVRSDALGEELATVATFA